jgi:hypothetical protein
MDTMWIGYLWGKIDDNMSIHDGLILRNLLDFVVSHDENGIRSLLPCFIVALRHTTKILPKCSLPQLHSGWIMH